MNEQEVINLMKQLVQVGTDNVEQWVVDNPYKASLILNAHYQHFLTEIIEQTIFEYED